MLVRRIRALAPAVVLLNAILAAAQTASDTTPVGDRPAPHVPVRTVSRRQLDHLEAVKLYGVASNLLRKNHLIEAVRTLEAAVRLDPDSPMPLRSLVPIYFALDRSDDAFAGCRRLLDLDPDDLQTAFLFGKELRSRSRKEEARTILEQAAARPALDAKLELKARLCFELAALYEDAKEWAAAEKNFRRVAEVLDHPDALLEEGPFNRAEIEDQAAETWERLGRACLEMKNFDRAIVAFQQSVKHDGLRSARLSLNLAGVLARAHRPADALPHLEKYLQTQPAGTEGYELRIKLQRELGRDDQVLPLLEASSRRDSYNIDLALLLAREYRTAGRSDRAEQVYNRLLAQRANTEAYRGLLAIQAKLPGGPDKILALLDVTARKAQGEGKDVPPDPDRASHLRAIAVVLRGDPALVKGLLIATGRKLSGGGGLAYGTRSLLAVLAARTRQLDIAEALYRSCVDDEGRVRNPDTEQEIYSGLLLVLSRAHKYDAIIGLCEKGLKTAEVTNRVLFHLYLAEALMARDKIKEALAAADSAVNDAGGDDRLMCRLNRAEFLTAAGRHAEAVAECRAMLKEYTKQVDLHKVRLRLSTVLSAAHDPAGAEEQLRQLLKEDPNDALVCNNLGYHLAEENKDLAEAEQLIRKALALDSDQRRGNREGVDDGENAAYLDSLGWALFRRGRLAEAVRELEKASSLADGEEDPVVWDHLGDAYWRLGKGPQAIAAWRKAIALYDLGVRRKTDGRYDDIRVKLEHHE
jgi:tetratricopeptide (TPR) repeat protein